jgi:hypothetical protein
MESPEKLARAFYAWGRADARAEAEGAWSLPGADAGWTVAGISLDEVRREYPEPRRD